MISAFLPLAPSAGRAVGRQRREDLGVPRCVLATVLLLELALRFLPQGMLLAPLQASVLFKQVSGYAMLALLLFAMGFGGLRRRPMPARRLRTLNDAHQFAGLLILLLLALHAGRSPSGFLLIAFHGMALGLAAGALRALLGTRIGRGAATALLATHISMSCLLSAAALLHLYFVYAYTA